MKHIILAIAILQMLCSICLADDYMKINIDSIPMGTPGVEFPFLVTRECDTGGNLTGASNGFEMNAIGCTWTYSHYTVDPEAALWWNVGGFGFTESQLIGTTNSASWLTGGGSFGAGMPITTNHPYFSIYLDISDDEGEICIDSAFYPVAGSWKWSGLTCGQGGAPDRPLFVDKYGSDDNHPICITVHDPSCLAPSFTTLPPGDMMEIGYWIQDVTWQFNADPGTMNWEPSHIVMWSVADGPGEIDSTGLYSTGNPLPIGDYNVTIEVHNECTYSSYGFTLSVFGDECGNADGKADVDIDDAVALIIYIFAGGYYIPTPVGDVNCSGGIDIDDATYLLRYIFRGDAAPCDPDDDGIPDCGIL